MIKTHLPLGTVEEKEPIIEETEELLRMAVVIELFMATAAPEDGVALINQFQIILMSMMNSYEREHIHMTITQFQPARPVGRPAVDIPENQLRFLAEHNFRITDITQLFGCSCHTIVRRLKEFDFEHNVYMGIDDSHLDAVVSDIAARLPCCRIKSMQSMLRANGIVLQREKSEGIALSCRSCGNPG